MRTSRNFLKKSSDDCSVKTDQNRKIELTVMLNRVSQLAQRGDKDDDDEG